MDIMDAIQQLFEYKLRALFADQTGLLDAVLVEVATIGKLCHDEDVVADSEPLYKVYGELAVLTEVHGGVLSDTELRFVRFILAMLNLFDCHISSG